MQSLKDLALMVSEKKANVQFLYFIYVFISHRKYICKLSPLICTCQERQYIAASVNHISLKCTPLHALSTPLLTLAPSILRTDVTSSKDSTPFLSLVLPSGTLSLSLCNMLTLCLPSKSQLCVFDV